MYKRQVFVAANATVLGDVTLGKGTNIWYGAVLRGDEGTLVLGENCNVQDNAVLHCDCLLYTSMRLKKKHIAAIALSVAICVGATGCKSEEVKNTDSGCSSERDTMCFSDSLDRKSVV